MTPPSSPEPTPAPPTVKRDLIVDAEAIIEAARVEISRLCHGHGGTTSEGIYGRSWTMSIPVQRNDSDMIFSALLNLAREQQRRLSSLSSSQDTRRIDAMESYLDGVRWSMHGNDENDGLVELVWFVGDGSPELRTHGATLREAADHALKAFDPAAMAAIEEAKS